nr:MAG TPA: hypothetical protein [Caudoviricetes sp.]
MAGVATGVFQHGHRETGRAQNHAVGPQNDSCPYNKKEAPPSDGFSVRKRGLCQ